MQRTVVVQQFELPAGDDRNLAMARPGGVGAGQGRRGGHFCFVANASNTAAFPKLSVMDDKGREQVRLAVSKR